jgi:hypothetical protein
VQKSKESAPRKRSVLRAGRGKLPDYGYSMRSSGESCNLAKQHRTDLECGEERSVLSVRWLLREGILADPITIGELVATAMSTVAEIMFKTSVEEGVKDAYKALKEAVANWVGKDVEELEKKPGSAARKAVIAEGINDRSPEDVDKIRSLLSTLIVRMKRNAPVGIDIKRLTALEADFSNLDVRSGTGVIIDDANVDVFKAPNMKIGHTPGK